MKRVLLLGAAALLFSAGLFIPSQLPWGEGGSLGYTTGFVLGHLAGVLTLVCVVFAYEREGEE